MSNPVDFHMGMVNKLMYYYKAMKEDNFSQFNQAVVKEVNSHVDSDHWELVKHQDVPRDQEVVLSMWLMWNKCYRTTNEMTTYKA